MFLFILWVGFDSNHFNFGVMKLEAGFKYDYQVYVKYNKDKPLKQWNAISTLTQFIRLWDIILPLPPLDFQENVY